MAMTRIVVLVSLAVFCLTTSTQAQLRADGLGVCSSLVTSIQSYVSYYTNAQGVSTSRLSYRIVSSTQFSCCPGWLASGDECPIFTCLNECLNGGTCVSNNTCSCPAGYTDSVCGTDVDECAVQNGGCTQLCTNLPGSFSCSCASGFALAVDQLTCEDVNECKSANPCSQLCINSVGSFNCSCLAGYQLASDLVTCQDVDECVPTSPCQDKCTNTNGSFTCSCAAGLALSSDGVSCQDVDECLAASVCAQLCVNSWSSFECECGPGFSLSANGTGCDDVDECLVNNGGCQSSCNNTIGSFTCVCPPGFQLQADGKSCSDVDECATPALNQCSDSCVNTNGSFKCFCPVGYKLFNQTACEDVDECAVNNGNCQHLCVNSPGSFSCKCNVGYVLLDNESACMKCGGSMSLLTDSVASPGYPYIGFSVSETCVWNITLPQFYRVNVSCAHVLFGDTGVCTYANLSLVLSATSTRKVCKPLTSYVQSSLNTLLLDYYNTGTGLSTGFQCDYNSIYRRRLTLTTATGAFSSPAETATTFASRANLTVTITRASATCTTFSAFSLPASSACGVSGDYLIVYDGATTLAPVRATYCGSTVPPGLLSAGASITFTFISDDINSTGGFNASYTTKSTCP